MSLEYALAAAGRRSRLPSGSASRRAFLAVGCVLAAAALAIGTAQASQAAAAPAPGWNTYITPLGGGQITGVYAPSLTDAFAVGSTTPTGGASAYLHFNGTAWSSFSGPNIGVPAAISGTSGSDVWVMGATTTAHYNGSSWTTFAPFVPSGATYDSGFDGPTAQVFAAGPSDVWAEVPVISDSNPATQETLLEHFDGTSWSLVTAPGVSSSTTDIGEITGSGPDDVYVAISTTGSTAPGQLLHFDGSAWSVESLPQEADLLEGGLSVTGPDDGLDLGITNDLSGYAAQLTDGTWSDATLPFSGAAPLTQTGGTGRVWATMSSNVTSGGPTSLWQWSAGKWQQIPDNADEAITAVADGSGLWTYNSASGSDATVGLYDAG